jgi:hypothetical protein
MFILHVLVGKLDYGVSESHVVDHVVESKSNTAPSDYEKTFATHPDSSSS